MFDTRETNIEMVQGDTLAFGIEFEDLEQDLDSAYLTCKDSFTAVSDVFRISLGSGIEKVADQEYRVRVAPEDTQNVTAGNYYYDLRIGVNGDVFTILKGVLRILPAVTDEGGD